MPRSPTNHDQTIAFEAALKRLEEVVRHLEAGDLTLEASLKTFEEGIKWSRGCETRLTEAKGSVEVLIKQANGDVTTEAFAPRENT